jgi:hypothetical protein
MKSTNDIWFSAFLIKNGFEITKYDIIGRGKIKCFFTITDEQWQKLKLLFSKSELSDYKNIIDKLKDLAFIFIGVILIRGGF